MCVSLGGGEGRCWGEMEGERGDERMARCQRRRLQVSGRNSRPWQGPTHDFAK
jgi:hypothetical protein